MKKGKKKKPSNEVLIAKYVFASTTMPVLHELIKLVEKLLK
jgi:hypothetical protein